MAAVYVAYLVPNQSEPGVRGEFVAYGLLAAVVWFASLIVHQVAHLWVAARLGGSIDRIVIGPLGDMVPVSLPHDPRGEVMTALAGPAAHMVMLVVFLPAFFVSRQDLSDPLLSPLAPQHLIEGGIVLAALKIVFWSNWLLLLFNLLPAFPLDGGRALASGLRPFLDEKGARLAVARGGAMVCILGLGIWGMVGSTAGALVPAWFPLTLIGLWLFFVARYELMHMDDDERDGDLLGYDFSQGYTSLEQHGDQPRRREPSFLNRWLQQRRELKQQRIREIEDDEERRVDQILARVKDIGLDALTAEERALLDRVSARYRDRLSS